MVMTQRQVSKVITTNALKTFSAARSQKVIDSGSIIASSRRVGFQLA